MRISYVEDPAQAERVCKKQIWTNITIWYKMKTDLVIKN